MCRLYFQIYQLSHWLQVKAYSFEMKSILKAFLSGPVATVFTNMYGCRIVTIVGACLAALGFFLSRWWENIVYYYITIGLMGGIIIIFVVILIPMNMIVFRHRLWIDLCTSYCFCWILFRKKAVISYGYSRKCIGFWYSYFSSIDALDD